MELAKNLNLTKKQQEVLIKGKLKLYGYSYGDQPMKVDRSFFEMGRVLLSLPQVSKVPSTEIFQMDESRIRTTSKEFFDRFFTLHNVRTISQNDFARIANQYCHGDVKPTDLLEFCEILESVSLEVSPFDLPVSYVSSDTVMTGGTQKPMFIKNNEKYLRRQNIYFSGISLGSPVSALTSYTYDHEITHTQVESVKGSVRDFHNSEVLPILVELIAAYETDLTGKRLTFMMSVRLRDVFEKMALLYRGGSEISDLLINTVYLKSTLQALHLFDIYQEASSDIRRLMINGIQEIFDGKQTLESFMMDYGVTFKKSSDVTLLKKYMRKY